MLSVAAGLLAWASTGTAQQRAIAPGAVMGTLTGTCSSLIVGGVDRTAQCSATIVNAAYKTGNGSFMFAMGDTVVSFFGRDSAAVGDQATIYLTKVFVNNGGKLDARQSSDVSGTCTYTNPHKGPVRLNCEATGAKGKYRAVFTSNGKMPEYIEL
jgi:hypothetical protein